MTERAFACPEAYTALRDAVSAGLKIVREHERRDAYISCHDNFPKMGYFDSGLPQFSKTTWGSEKAPRNYMSVFRDARKPDKIPEWQPFYGLVRSSERLRRYYDESPIYRSEVLGSAKVQDMLERDLNFMIGYTIEMLVDRYIHLNQAKEFDESRFIPIYQEWENAVFWDKVVFDVLVPLLLVTCAFDALEIGEDLAIEKMEESFQLARSGHSMFPVSANECVVGAATHALVLRHWSTENDSRVARLSKLRNVENFHNIIQTVDRFFAALRAISGSRRATANSVCVPTGGPTRGMLIFRMSISCR